MNALALFLEPYNHHAQELSKQLTSVRIELIAFAKNAGSCFSIRVAAAHLNGFFLIDLLIDAPAFHVSQGIIL